MGDAYIVRRGGFSEAFAVIRAVYPSGSVCTCTKGSKVLRAKGTGGEYLFLLPEGGSWTVSCSGGGQTASKSVNLSRFESREVILSYWDGTLFDNGSQYTSVTGGWDASGTASVGQTLYVMASAGQNALVMTHNAVPFYGYSELHFDLSSIDKEVYLGVTSQPYTHSRDAYENAVAGARVFETETSSDYVLSVAELNAAYYPFLGTYSTDNMSYGCTAARVWLT